jgi:hypothetical protein
VKEVRLERLQTDRRPTHDQLSVTLPAGTFLNDNVSVGGQFRLASTRQVAYGDLEPLWQRAQRSAERYRTKSRNSAYDVAQASTWRPWIIAANALLVLAVVGYLVWRRNR